MSMRKFRDAMPAACFKVVTQDAVSIVALCVLLASPGVSAQEQVLGLLTLPSVFGPAPCQRVSPGEIRLYSAPGTGSAIGSIRVDTPMTMRAEGGCDGPVVSVHRSSQSDVRPLPTREFDYEQPGAIVVDRQDQWFKVRLSDGSAWLQAPRSAEFLSLSRLLIGKLTYLTEDWDGRLASVPSAQLRGEPRNDLSEQPARVTEVRRSANGFWLRVEVLEHSSCETGDAARVTAQGWVPAHAVSGEPTAWFYSRGC